MAKIKIDQEKMVRYILTIGFTLFIFIILFLFLVVSRLVLSDTTPFGEHVKTTKDLLQNIDKVEKAAAQDPNQINYSYKQNNAFLKLHYVHVNITDVSYANLNNNNKSVLTIIFDKKIQTTQNGIYYFEIENIDGLEKGELIVYNSANPTVGEFLEFETETHAAIANSDTKEVEIVSSTEIIGRVFLDQKND